MILTGYNESYHRSGPWIAVICFWWIFSDFGIFVFGLWKVRFLLPFLLTPKLLLFFSFYFEMGCLGAKPDLFLLLNDIALKEDEKKSWKVEKLKSWKVEKLKIYSKITKNNEERKKESRTDWIGKLI
jgi:hypothetical protein